MTTLRRCWPAFALLLLLAALAACDATRQLHPDFPVDPKGGVVDPATTGSLTGKVSGPTGAAVPFAEVVIGEIRGFADQTGQFNVGDLAPGAAAIAIRKDDRTSVNYRPAQVLAGGSVHYPGIVLRPLVLAGAVPAASGGHVALADGTGLTIPAAAFVRDGQPFSGNAGVFMAAARPADPTFLEATPGASRGVDADGNEVYLQVAGVAWFSVIGAGSSLALAAGATVEVTFPLPDEQAATAPGTIDVWQIDPATALWRHLGVSQLEDQAYTATIDVLRPVCWASPRADICWISGAVADQQGIALGGARVVGRGLGLGGGLFTDAITDAEGRFTLAALGEMDTEVLPLSGNIAGAPDTVAAGTPCPVDLARTLSVSLPDVRMDLHWSLTTDLDTHLDIAGRWVLNYLFTGDLVRDPYTELDGDDRTGAQGEHVVGRRWHQGTTAYWVHAYDLGRSEAMLATGALVELGIGDSTWTFAVADAPFPYQVVGTDTTVADSTGWWHVFDIQVSGLQVAINPVNAFAAPPLGLARRVAAEKTVELAAPSRYTPISQNCARI
ncbi:MAG: carboxypeptidase-like regulatory domain-containing protein [Candidatus Krumholzibacteriia bacterium]